MPDPGYVQEAVSGSELLIAETIPIADFDLNAEVTLEAIYFDSLPKGILNPADGYTLIKVVVNVTNTGIDFFPLNPAAFSVEYAETTAAISPLVDKAHDRALLEMQSLGIGESASGNLYFELPADQQVTLVYNGYDKSYRFTSVKP